MLLPLYKRSITIWISITLPLALLNHRIYSNPQISLVGFMENMDELKQILNGINSFIAKISTFTSFIGISTILLFIAVLILSAGLSIIGIPRGKASCFLSLIIADSIWIAWERSFNSGSFEHVLAIIKSNLLLLIPLILVIIASTLFPKIKRFIFHTFQRVKRVKSQTASKRQIVHYFDEYQKAKINLEHALLQDMSNAKNDSVLLSPETETSARNLTRIIQTLFPSKE